MQIQLNEKILPEFSEIRDGIDQMIRLEKSTGQKKRVKTSTDESQTFQMNRSQTI